MQAEAAMHKDKTAAMARSLQVCVQLFRFAGLVTDSPLPQAVQSHNDQLRDQHTHMYGQLKKLATLEAQEAAALDIGDTH